ncbi:MAG: DUF3365 domain-containing protein [Gammaproteobacteria bacterium]|nr:DUF3365 domain-containing protein [Gammaproteobacteria bacterium]
MYKHVLGISLLLVASGVQADSVQQSRIVVKNFMGELKSELVAAMKSGGPVNAIDVCNIKAPAIAEEMSKKHGVKISRTSLKLRNQANKPDAWELKVLNRFETRKTKGENVKNMEFSEVVSQKGKNVFRYMKAIPTGKPCLNCHATEIEPAVISKLSKLYPQDKARGFKLGDIRGAFTLSKAVE